MAERITIDTDVLAQEISTLASVRAKTVTDPTVSLVSKGQTARVTSGLAALYTELDTALNTLIDNTSTFLINAMDGFVDVDEAAASVITRLEAEVES